MEKRDVTALLSHLNGCVKTWHHSLSSLRPSSAFFEKGESYGYEQLDLAWLT
jgi:hypothetical protein